MPVSSSPEIVPFERQHLPGILELFAAERWSYTDDEQLGFRRVSGFRQMAMHLKRSGTV